MCRGAPFARTYSGHVMYHVTLSRDPSRITDVVWMAASVVHMVAFNVVYIVAANVGLFGVIKCCVYCSISN